MKSKLTPCLRSHPCNQLSHWDHNNPFWVWKCSWNLHCLFTVGVFLCRDAKSTLVLFFSNFRVNLIFYFLDVYLSVTDNVQNNIVAETTVSLFDIPARLGTSIMTIFRDHDDDRDAEYLLIPRSKLVQTSPPLSSKLGVGKPCRVRFSKNFVINSQFFFFNIYFVRFLPQCSQKSIIF